MLLNTGAKEQRVTVQAREWHSVAEITSSNKLTEAVVKGRDQTELDYSLKIDEDILLL